MKIYEFNGLEIKVFGFLNEYFPSFEILKSAFRRLVNKTHK